jgi:hypothetical protein
VARQTFAPGAGTGWQRPEGPALVIVVGGTVTKYSADDARAETFAAGQIVPIIGPRDRNMLRNEGTAPAETIIVVFRPLARDQAAT